MKHTEFDFIFLLFSSSFGVLIGYIATAQMIRLLTWEWSFYLQIIATVPLWLFIVFTPNELLEVNSDDEVDEMEANAIKENNVSSLKRTTT